MAPSPDSPDPARRERARRPLLLQGLALSVALHVAVVALWPEHAAPPRAREVVLLYPELVRPARQERLRVRPDPEPAGGSASGAPAAPAPPPPAPPPTLAPPSPVPPSSPPAPRLAAVRPVDAPTPPPPRPAPAPPPAATGAGGTGAGAAGDGGGSGAGAGSGKYEGAGTGDGGGDGTGDGPAAVVAEPERAPFAVNIVLPVYPDAARREGVRARVRVEVLVDATGQVRDARIVTRLRIGRGDREEAVAALPHGLDEAALAAARASRFRPARQAGQAVPAHATVTLSFGV